MEKNSRRQLSEEEYKERLMKTSLTEDEVDKVVQRLRDKGVYKNGTS